MTFLHDKMIAIKKRLADAQLLNQRRRNPLYNTYSRTELNRLLVLFIHAIQNGQTLQVPEVPLAQDDILHYIDMQLHVEVTLQQVQCLCHKLHTTEKTKKMNRREFLRSYSTEVKRSVEDGERMGTSSLHGQLLNDFFEQLKKYMA